ncbi:MAG: O-antigen ligase family protein [Bacteroidetes bacterium]|nr:O-antigen ligase family protein [Bacteroidota bacterium]
MESLKYLTVLIFTGCLLYQLWVDTDFVFEVLKKLRISAVFAIVFLILQMIMGLKFSFFEPSGNAYLFDAQIRYPGMFTDPQQNAQYLAMSSFLFLAGYHHRENVIIRFLLFAALLLAIFFTGVRAAFLGVIVGIAVLSLFGRSKFRVAALAALMAGSVVYYFFGNSIVLFNREISAGEMGDIRFEYWRAAIQLFNTHILMGIGVGNYQPFVSFFDQNQYWESFGEFEYIVHPESGYLKLLVELGIISSTIFLFLLLEPLLLSVRIWFQAASEKKELVLVLASALLCWMVSFVTVFSFADARIMLMVATLSTILHSVSQYNNTENA